MFTVDIVHETQQYNVHKLVYKIFDKNVHFGPKINNDFNDFWSKIGPKLDQKRG